MSTAKPLLVFDFDGVISESVHDSFRTAINAFIDLFPDHRLGAAETVIPVEKIYQFERENSRIYHNFRNLMPFGNRAEDYFVILKIIERNQASEITDQSAYDRFKVSLPPDDLELYQQTFYSLRRTYQKDPEIWIKLLPAFPGITEAIRKLSKKYRLAIATSKDLASVRLQLNAYRLQTYFTEDCILDKEVSNSKRNHLKKLHAHLGIPYEKMHFIDDKFIHLLDAHTLGVQCYLATWGFNTRREHRLADKQGFHLLTLDKLPDL